MFQIGKRIFKTKKSAIEEAKDILSKYKSAPTPITGVDLDLLLSLFNMHPSWEEKQGCGIQSVTVEQNPPPPSAFCFWITRTDGSKTDISYKKCFHKDSHTSAVKRAFRREIVDQVHNFKLDNLFPGCKCAVTGECLDYYNSESINVDHSPPFADILKAFLSSVEIKIEQVKLTKTRDSKKGRRISDIGLAKKWRIFHRENAKLRLTTQYANQILLRKKGKPPKEIDLGHWSPT